MEQLLEIMARLRDPESGCPWDLEQTFQSIAPHTIEEAYEVAEAIRRGDMTELKDELGDLLFQVVFYAQLAREKGDFEFADVSRAISDKMLRRHPHVFGTAQVAGVAEQSAEWERHKEQERRGREADSGSSCMDGVALALPALIRAGKLQKRAAQVGFDWSSIEGVLAKLEEEIAELRDVLGGAPNRDLLEEELGDLLFTCVNIARYLGVNAETALRGANQKFEHRFRLVESCLAARGQDVSGADTAQMNLIWERVKGGHD